MYTRYSKEFKIEAVRKVLLRSKGLSIASVSRLIGVKIPTLHGWVKEMTNTSRKESPTSGGGGIQKSPCTWTSAEKFEAIMGAAKLSSEDLGEYCRKQGIFPHHLEAWKVEFIESQDKSRGLNGKEVKDLKNEVKSLATELRRKEKALAETAALLVLKKKHTVFGETTRKIDFRK